MFVNACVVGIVSVGLVWTVQHRMQIVDFLVGDFIDSDTTAELALTSQSVAHEPAAVLNRRTGEYPVTGPEDLVGTWVTKNTRTFQGTKAYPGAVFRFEKSGAAKLLTHAGRRDGQPLSKVEAQGLQVHFQKVYEIKRGAVVIYADGSDLVFFAGRKDEALVLTQIDIATGDPTVERVLLPAKYVN